MWSPVTQAGADVMKRIAAPMIGGVITSAILELLIYPVIYVIWRRRELPDKTEEEPAPLLPPALAVSRKNRQRLFKWIALIIGLVAIFYVGNLAWHKLRPTQISAAPFLTQNVNDLTANFIAREGQLQKGDNNILIEFRDSDGQLVDVGDVNFTIDMNMPGVVMHGGGPAQKTGTTGQYRAKVRADMPGDWSAKVSYKGAKGNGQATFPINVKP
jgi:hypothetical protein